MEILKNLVNEKSLIMTFEHAFVSNENTALLNKIHTMNPDTIDWSNIPDYLSKEEFLDLAKKMSGKNTVHCMHLMNWMERVPGTSIRDYPEDDRKRILESCLDTVASDHDMKLNIKNSLYS